MGPAAAAAALAVMVGCSGALEETAALEESSAEEPKAGEKAMEMMAALEEGSVEMVAVVLVASQQCKLQGP